MKNSFVGGGGDGKCISVISHFPKKYGYNTFLWCTGSPLSIAELKCRVLLLICLWFLNKIAELV